MTKSHILSEIHRTAIENGGIPLGRQRFENATGIGIHDWYGIHWVRWSDALSEAGFTPNKFSTAIPEEQLLEHLATLARELGHFPLTAEIRMKSHSDPTFPSHSTFNRLGRKSEAITKLREYSASKGYDDVISMCVPVKVESDHPEGEIYSYKEQDHGFVYLLRSGRYYKIGRTNSLGRRERELAIQLPEQAVVVHSIKTDDPVGIESYWHRRFESQRRNGEWFELTPIHVAAFKRRKFM